MKFLNVRVICLIQMVEFCEGKLWFQKTGTKIVLGITPLAIESTGDVRAIEFVRVGEAVDKDDVVCELDCEDGTIKVYSPIAGVVSEMNTSLSDNLVLLNEDPLEEGWLLTIDIYER